MKKVKPLQYDELLTLPFAEVKKLERKLEALPISSDKVKYGYITHQCDTRFPLLLKRVRHVIKTTNQSTMKDQ